MNPGERRSALGKAVLPRDSCRSITYGDINHLPSGKAGAGMLSESAGKSSREHRASVTERGSLQPTEAGRLLASIAMRLVS